ncbi:MAG: LysR family transcriptional regulator [Proteobacteria bacterium]|nr:LysR family transcriptional regulator [Pseudomonadota bacterium]
METRTLRYFQAVAEFGSYSRAAEFLRISQPAISRQVRRLEAELGSALFARHGHGVSLTDAGRVLLQRSQVFLRQLEQVAAEIRGGNAGPSGMITFAVPPAAGHFLIPALTARFAAAYPNVYLKVIGGFSGYIHEWLMRGQVDLACLHDPMPQRGFAITPLVKEPVYLVGKPGSFPFARDPLGTADLARVPLILPSRPNASRRLLDSWIAARGIALNVIMEVDDPGLIRALLRDGLGFSLLTQGGFVSEVRLGVLEARPFRPAAAWRLALVTPTGVARPDIIAPFADMVRATARALTRSGAWPGQCLVGR